MALQQLQATDIAAVSNTAITGTINLSTTVSGILPAVNGGTGVTSLPYIIDYLIVGGGGGGGGGCGTGGGTDGGGGGSGGFLTGSSYLLKAGITYTVTIGAGGSGGAGNNSGVRLTEKLSPGYNPYK